VTSIRRRVAVGIICLAVATAFAAPCGQQTTAYACVITEVTGEVTHFGIGQTADSEPLQVKRGMLLPAGTRIVTGPNATVGLSFADGSTARLSENADVVVGVRGVTGAPDEQGKASLNPPQIIVLLGRLWVQVTRRMQATPSFEVHTPAAAIVVRGTEFSVDVDRDDTVYVYVKSGVVTVENAMGRVDLEAGQAAQVAPGAVPLLTEPMAAADDQDGDLDDQGHDQRDEEDDQGHGQRDEEDDDTDDSDPNGDSQDSQEK